MRVSISRSGKRIGVLRTTKRSLSLSTRDRELRKLFDEARKNGIDVHGAAAGGTLLCPVLISTREHKPFAADHPDAIGEWVRHLQIRGYRVEPVENS